jgi:hypothetical protein
MTLVPLQYMGEGEFRTPNKYHARAADKALVIGEISTWEQVHERSQKSHAHYFASVHDAWLNLPEAIAGEFPTEESLRKYALIKTGYCTVKKIVCANNREANAAVTLYYELDAFLLCEVVGNVATIYRAHSQSVKAMGKDIFQKSKSDVLDLISTMIGADAQQAEIAA